MKVRSTTVQMNMQVQQQSTPEELAAKEKMKELQHKMVDLEKFEKTTKRNMQDRMKFMSGKNALSHQQVLKDLEKEKALLRETLIDLQDRNY